MRRFKYTLMFVLPFTIVSTGIRHDWGFRDTFYGGVAMLLSAVVVGNVLEWLVWGGDHRQDRENQT
jgi:hypothetical protein